MSATTCDAVNGDSNAPFNNANPSPLANQFRAFYPPSLPVNDKALDTWSEIVFNALSSRSEFFRKFTDPRRNLNDECGYPDGWITADRLNDLYEREAIAARVVEIEPDETWQVQPLVYESEDSEEPTEFEKAWDELGQQLRGEDCYFKEEEGSPVWEYLYRLDRLCGIGMYGVLLLGLDDGLPLDQPVQGVYEQGSLPIDKPVGQDQAVGKQYPGGTGAPGTVASGPSGGSVGSLFSSTQPGQGQTSYSPPNSAASPYPNRTNDGRNAVTGGAPNDEEGMEDSPYGADDPRRKRQPASPTRNQYQHLKGIDAYPRYSLTVNAGEAKGRKLLYLRVFPEHLCQITQFESNPASPRFGQPVMYLLTFNDPREQQMGGIGLTTATLNVHWTRVIHVADNLASSEVFGVPRMRPVLRRLLDLEKLYGGSAEMYWRGAFPGISFETHPQLGGDVNLDATTLRSEFEKYSNGLQRAMYLMGMTAKTLAPQVVDPTSQINVQIEAICIKKGIPVRIFKGSERGELASDQDKGTWASRIRGRQKNFVTPRIIIPFVDRMITYGILPKPNYVEPQIDPVSGLPLDPATGLPQDPLQQSTSPGQTPLENNPEGLSPEDAAEIDRMIGVAPGEEGLEGEGEEEEFAARDANGNPIRKKPKLPAMNRLYTPALTNNAFPPKRTAKAPTTKGRPAAPGPGLPSRLSPEKGAAPVEVDDEEADPQAALMDKFDKGTRVPAGGKTPVGKNGKPFARGPAFGRGTGTPADPANPYGPAGQGPVKIESKLGYYVEWPDPDSQSDIEQAQVAAARVQAMAAYVSGQLNTLMPEAAFMTEIMGFEEEKVNQWTEQAAVAAQEQEMLDLEKQMMMVEQGLAPDMSDPDTLEAMAPKGGPPGGGGPPKPPFGGPPGTKPKGAKPGLPGMNKKPGIPVPGTKKPF